MSTVKRRSIFDLLHEDDNFAAGRKRENVENRLVSLRRHDPDQVQRVGRATCLSALQINGHPDERLTDIGQLGQYLYKRDCVVLQRP